MGVFLIEVADGQYDLAMNLYGFDKATWSYAYVVVAGSETEARRMAADKSNPRHENPGLWLDSEASTCREIDGLQSGVVFTADGTG